MKRKFQLQEGMFLVITRALEFETAEIIAYGFDYCEIWRYWMNYKQHEWDLAQVVGGQVYRIKKPIPPAKYLKRLEEYRGKHGKA